MSITHRVQRNAPSVMTMTHRSNSRPIKSQWEQTLNFPISLTTNAWLNLPRSCTTSRTTHPRSHHKRLMIARDRSRHSKCREEVCTGPVIGGNTKRWDGVGDKLRKNPAAGQRRPEGVNAEGERSHTWVGCMGGGGVGGGGGSDRLDGPDRPECASFVTFFVLPQLAQPFRPI